MLKIEEIKKIDKKHIALIDTSSMDDLCDILEDEILKSKSSEEEKKALLKRLRNFCNTETNIMLTTRRLRLASLFPVR